MRQLIGTGLLVLLFVGCATVPPNNVWRPWFDTYGNAESVELNKAVSIKVTVEGGPVIGKPDLPATRLEKRIRETLERRGYETVEAEAAQTGEVTVEISRVQKTSSVSSTSSTTVSTQTQMKGLTPVSALALVASQSQTTGQAVRSTESTQTETVYRYDLALDMSDGDTSVWKGLATWETASFEPIEGPLYAVRVLSQQLPRDLSIVPNVPALKREKAPVYYNRSIRNNRFISPALHSTVYVEDSGGKARTLAEINLAFAREDLAALPAFVDLIRHAETALPVGDESYEYPMDRSLWKQVKLGGKYRIGDDSDVSYALLELRGSNKGYRLTSARLVSKAKYEQFKQQLAEWRSEVRSFTDVYRQ